MTASTLHPLASEWLDRLRVASADLPSSERTELLSDIEAHLAESIPPDASEAQVRTVLERMGDPEEIVAEAVAAAEVAPTRRGFREWVAVILLLGGGFLFVFGWIVGVFMLWSSKAWTVRDKLIGTLVIPGGLATAVALTGVTLLSATQTCTSRGNGPSVCTGGISQTEGNLILLGLIASVVLPIVTAIYLARRADRPRAV
jgi:uncharacterized membrane protein